MQQTCLENNISKLNDYAVLLGFGQAFERMQQAKSKGNAKKPKPKVQQAKSDPKLKKKFGSFFFKRKVAPPPVIPVEPVSPEAPAPVPVAAAHVPVAPVEPENPCWTTNAS